MESEHQFYFSWFWYELEERLFAVSIAVDRMLSTCIASTYLSPCSLLIAA